MHHAPPRSLTGSSPRACMCPTATTWECTAIAAPPANRPVYSSTSPSPSPRRSRHHGACQPRSDCSPSKGAVTADVAHHRTPGKTSEPDHSLACCLSGTARYQHNDDGKSKLRDRVAAAQWRRQQMRTTGKDFIRRNKHRARTAKLRERPGKVQARRVQSQRFTRSAGMGHSSSSVSLATTPVLGRTHTAAFGSSSGGAPSSPLRYGSSRGLRRTNTEPIFKLMDSRTVPGT